MITIADKRILQDVSEFPELPERIKILYLDLETTSFDSNEEAYLPYNGHRAAGIAFTWDDHPVAYYIPIRHTMGKNLDPKTVMDWIKDLFSRAEEWVNHNVKFDAHFLAVEDVYFSGPMVCTLTLSKVHNSDRFQHDLESVCKDWLAIEFPQYARVSAFLKGMKSKNYGDVPIDILGEYACHDVLSNRRLYLFLLENRPEQVIGIWNTEIKMTSVLFDMEREGLRIDKMECKRELGRSLKLLIEAGDALHELTGREFTNSAQCIFDILINQCGLPVLAYNEDSGSPSFDKKALALYAVHPMVIADEKIRTILNWITVYRKESTFKGLFPETFLRLADEKSHLHPSYNQTVRTGRMSCKDPNSQQQNSRSKALIHPEDGEAFLSCDASQIEFRLIVHYIKDETAIAAYVNDKKTDFHKWTSEELGVKRKPAKAINFGVGYGAGKKKVVSMLMADPDVMAEVGEVVNELVASGKIKEKDRALEFKRLCQQKAEDIYHKYHERFPGIKAVSRIAMLNCKRRGYCFNAFGRRRHLPARNSHKAFNTVVQGCAGDYVKDRMVALAPRFNEQMRSWGIRIAANVHDELLFAGPKERMQSPEVQDYILSTLQTQSIPFRVPFYWKMGYSEKSWAEAGGDDPVLVDGVYSGGPLPGR